MLARFSVRLAGLVALLCWVPSPALAQRGSEPTKNHPRVHEAFRGIVAKVNGSVVRVLSEGKEIALGTIVGSDGLILTKHSLLRDSLEVKMGDGKTLPATVLGVKDDHDLALLKVQASDLPAVQFRPSKSTQVGDWVVAAGTDRDPIAVGVVSVAFRTMTRRGDYPPSSNPNSGFLGIGLSDEGNDGGVKIGNVQENTAAAKAGLKVGDVILSINKKPIRDPETLMSTIASYKPKDVITLRIKRDGEEQEVKATLGTRPGGAAGGRGDFQNRLGNELSERRTGFPAILQHDTLVKPAQCGGPLVDLDGKVVGINIARAGRIETYAIPSENVLALLDELKSGKLAPKEVGSKPQPKPEPDRTKLNELEQGVQSAQEKLKSAEDKAAVARKFLKSAEETAEQFGKDNPDLIEARDKARKLVTLAEQAVTKAKTDLEKAKTALDRAKKQ